MEKYKVGIWEQVFDFVTWLVIISFLGITIFFDIKQQISIPKLLYPVLILMFGYTWVIRKERKKNYERRERFSYLQQASLSLASSLNLLEVFKTIAETSLLIEKEASACIIEQITAGEPQPRFFLHIQEKPDNTYGKMVVEKENFIFQGIPRDGPSWSIGYKWFIGIPLKLGENIIGCLELYFKKKKKIDKEEIEALIALCKYSAGAITNASAYEETVLALKREKQAFLAISQVDRSLREERLDLEDQLNVILKEAFRATGAVKSEVWVLDEDVNELLCITVYPLVDMVYGVKCKAGDGSLVGETAKSKKHINCTNLQDDPRWTNPLKRRVSTGLFIPLVYREKFVGVMALFNKRGIEAFTNEDINILEGLATQAAIAIFQTKTYYKLKNATSSLVALYEISRTLAEGKELERVLNLILKKGCELFFCDNGSIMLLDEKTGELTIKTAIGLSDEVIRTTKKYVGDGSIAGWVAKEKKPLTLFGRVADERFMSVKEKVKDALCVPMIAKNRLVGVFSLSNRKGSDVFTQSDMELLTTLANEAALAIETALLYDLAQKRIKELLGIKKIASEMMITRDAKEMLGFCLNVGREVLDCEFSWFFEPKDGKYFLLSARGKGRMDERDFEGQAKIGDNTIKWIGENRKPLIIDNCEEDPRFSPIKQFSAENLLGVPVVLGENVLGVIEFFNRQPYFTKDDVRLGLVLADQMAIAIENANLFYETKKKALELSTINQIVGEMVSSTSIDELISKVVSFTTKILRSKKAWFHIVEDRELILKGETGLSDMEKKRENELVLKKGVAGVCALEKEAILISSLRDDKRIRDEDKRMYRDGSYLSAPVFIRNEVVGVLSVSDKLIGSFTEDDLSLLTTLTSQISISVENIRLYLNIENYVRDTFKILSSVVETRDPRTRGHSEKVSKYAGSLAREAGLKDEEIKRIVDASYLVDIGKLGIPENIILKEESDLSLPEIETIKRHPFIGIQMLRQHSSFRGIIQIIYHHHENYDGTGYPDGISGESIPIGSRIIAVCDSYLTALQKGKKKEEVIDFLKRRAASDFDPELVSIFINNVLPKEE
ncbi:TPA: hypothetical protein DCX16_06950 [bacterium]|nr:hypothetical protein [bacterium]